MTHEIDWKPEYNTGNIMVDREHQELIKLVNLLLSATKNDHGEVAIKDAFDALTRYMDTHFKDEETLLDAVDSPYLIPQCDLHNMLRKELNDLWSTEVKKSNKGTMMGLTSWAENRLLKHFLINDYAAFHDFPFNNEEHKAN